MRTEGLPAAARGAFVDRCGQQSAVHAPGQSVGEESRGAVFGHRVGFVVEHARMPRSAGVLTGDDGFRHAEERPPVVVVHRVALGKGVEQDGQRGVAPAVAAAPEDLFAVLLAFAEIARVAVVKPFGRVEEAARRGVEFAVHELPVAVVARDVRQQGVDRGRHEQGVAPAPAVRAVFGLDVHLGLRREGDHRVGPLFYGAQHRRVPVAFVQHQTGLPDADVVGMILPPPHAPAVAAPDFEDELLAGLVSRDIGPGEHPAVECAVGPVLVAARAGAGEVFAEVVDLPLRHPVGDLGVAFAGGFGRDARKRCGQQKEEESCLIHSSEV